MSTIRVGHDEITFRVTSDESAGELVAIDVQLPAGGGPPMLHRHPSSEVYRVDAGELAIYVADRDGVVQRIVAEPDDVVLIPGGREHTVRNESEAGAQAYVTFVPGTEFEGFIRAAAALSENGPPAMEDVLALAERWGVEMTGPVPDEAAEITPDRSGRR